MDLPLGNQYAQLLHAAGESFYLYRPIDEDISGTYAVSLWARDESHLAQIEQALLQNNIKHAAIREPDLGNSLCAIGICPTRDIKLIKKLLRGLPLAGSQTMSKGEQNGLQRT
jgi:hypothetical protein